MRGPTAEQEQRQSVRERPILFSGPMVRAIIDGRKTQTRRVVSDLNSVGNFKASELLLDDPRTFADGGPSPAGNAGPYLHAFVNAPLIETRRKWERGDCDPAVMERLYPRYQVGDRLWVRETWAQLADSQIDRLSIPLRIVIWDPGSNPEDGIGGAVHAASYPAHVAQPERWKPSIHMPRWASRLTLEITDVGVERLQGITEDDAIDEGIGPIINDPLTDGYGEWKKPYVISARDQFRVLWDEINTGRKVGHNTNPCWAANPWVWVISFQSPAQTATSKKGGKQ